MKQFSSLFGGEGFVMRIDYEGEVLIQSRSIDGMAFGSTPYCKKGKYMDIEINYRPSQTAAKNKNESSRRFLC